MILGKKFSNFLNSDIRKKFYKIEKIIGFRIYPTYFCEKGIKSLYSKIILNFLLIGKSKNFKKFFYQEIISHSNQKKKYSYFITSVRKYGHKIDVKQLF